MKALSPEKIGLRLWVPRAEKFKKILASLGVGDLCWDGEKKSDPKSKIGTKS